MRFITLVSLFVMLFSETVFADTDESEIRESHEEFESLTPEEEAKDVKEFLCDGDPTHILDSIDECLVENGLNEIVKKVIDYCYPHDGNLLTAEEMRRWHCDNTEKKIAEIITCEKSSFVKYKDDESTVKWMRTFANCLSKKFDLDSTDYHLIGTY